MMAEAEARTQLDLYRSKHAIDPEYPRGTRFENYCRHCGIRLYEIKGGFRHDEGEVYRLVHAAPLRWPHEVKR